MIGYRGYKTKELADKHLGTTLFTIVFERKGEIVNKNVSKLYFLSTTKEYAKLYGTHLTSWKTSDNLLDLRTQKGQEKIAPYMKKYLNSEKEATIKNANFMMRIAKTTKEKKNALQFLDIANKHVQPLSSLNSQWSSDNEFGVEMRKALTKLKYDGAIFSEGKTGATIILLNRPTPIK